MYRVRRTILITLSIVAIVASVVGPSAPAAAADEGDLSITSSVFPGPGLRAVRASVTCCKRSTTERRPRRT